LAKIAVAFNRQILPNFFRRVWRMLGTPSLWIPSLRRGRGARIRARQRYKGVDHAR
jgi:hypothetical protein